MREKLIELIADIGWCDYGKMADHLIANGVTIATDTNVGDKWISVKDRLPDTFGEFIVCVQYADGRRHSDYADFDPYVKKWKTGLFFGEHDKVTHWMPLPEPPKGE